MPTTFIPLNRNWTATHTYIFLVCKYCKQFQVGSTYYPLGTKYDLYLRQKKSKLISWMCFWNVDIDKLFSFRIFLFIFSIANKLPWWVFVWNNATFRISFFFSQLWSTRKSSSKFHRTLNRVTFCHFQFEISFSRSKISLVQQYLYSLRAESQFGWCFFLSFTVLQK